MTARDEIWDIILRELVREGKLKISDLDTDESRRQTVRRVCREMEELGWLKRDSKQAKTWRAGPLAEKVLDLEPRAEVMKDE